MLKKIIIKGMSCSHCVNHVREALSELKDSQKVEVNLEQKYAIVETSSNDEEIKEKEEDQGYDVISKENIKWTVTLKYEIL